MAQTFKNYNVGNVTIEDALVAWENGQLPKNVLETFDSIITDITIRSLHQSNFKMFKDSLIVDNFIEVGNLMLVVTKNGYGWQIVLHKRDKDGRLVHQEIFFVKSNNKLKNAISDTLWNN